MRLLQDSVLVATHHEAVIVEPADVRLVLRQRGERPAAERAPEDAFLEYPPYYTRQPREETWRKQCELRGRALRRCVERGRRESDERARRTAD